MTELPDPEPTKSWGCWATGADDWSGGACTVGAGGWMEMGSSCATFIGGSTVMTKYVIHEGGAGARQNNG